LNKDIFNTKDILKRNVKLTSTQLYNHIMGRGGHLDIALDLSSISKTVEDPDYIYESKSNKQRDLYFRYGIHKVIKNKYIKVVVDNTNPSMGNVITSFLVKTVSGDLGRLRYEKSTGI
jgi:hypothetical protein